MVISSIASCNIYIYIYIIYVQYKATLAITSAIQGTFRDKIYQELELESLKSRRWYKRLVCMFKLMNEKAPNYLINLIPKYEPTIRIRNNSISSYKCRTNRFKYSFFPSTLNDWFNLDIRKTKSQFPYSSVGYFLLFVQLKISYTIFLTLED